MNATSAPSAPGRGASSISRTPACRQLGQRGVDVVDAQRDVVQPGPALARGTSRSASPARSPRAAPASRLAGRQEVRAHLLRRHLLGVLDLEAERIAIERQRRREVLHRDADVIEPHLHDAALACQRPRQDLGGGRVRIDLARARCGRPAPANSPGREAPRCSTCARNRCASSSRSRNSCRAARRRGRSLAGMGAEAADRLPQLGHAAPGRRLGLDDRRPPLRPRDTPAAPGSTRSTVTIRSAPSRSALLTTKMSAISMMPAFSACTSSPVPGHEHDDRDVRGADDVHFVLADADGLDDDERLAGGVEHQRDIAWWRGPGRRGGRAWPCCG